MNEWEPVPIDATTWMRPATAADVDAVAALHAAAWGRDGASAGDVARASDLLRRPHPTFQPGDMVLVEDRRSGALLAAQHLTTHRWTYGGVPVTVGEIEHVATAPHARRRGLVRAMTALVHDWSSQRGHDAMVVNGIPWLYTRFGYELALEKWWGPSVRVEVLSVPASPVRLREAQGADDLQVVADAYARGTDQLLVAYDRTAEHWRYEAQRSENNPWRRELLIAEQADGTPIGFALVTDAGPDRAVRQVDALELLPGLDWHTHVDGMLDTLATAADGHRYDTLRLAWLGRGHPAQLARPSTLTVAPRTRRGAWYVRVPDVAAFLATIRPALERRLAASQLATARGELAIQQWGGESLAIRYDNGVVDVLPWRPSSLFDGHLRIEPGLLLQLVLGYRSVDALLESHAYRILPSPDARDVLDVLFPTGRSHVLPVY